MQRKSIRFVLQHFVCFYMHKTSKDNFFGSNFHTNKMRLHVIYFFYLVINLNVKLVLMDFYSSMLALTQLSKEEVRMVSGLKRYINAEKSEENNVDEHLLRFLNSTENKITDEKVPDNPIDAFQLLKRWVVDWDKCFQMVFCSGCVEDGPAIDFNLTQSIVKKRLNGWPLQEDLDASINAIFRLWDTYEFDLHDLFHGKILDFQTHPFTTDDILYIANRAEQNGDMYSAIRFLETLLDEIKSGNFQNSGISEIKIARATASAYNRNDMPWKSIAILKDYIAKEPNHKGLNADYQFFSTKADKILETEKIDILEKPNKYVIKRPDGGVYPVDVVKNYTALCRGDIKTEKELSRLYCYNGKTEIPIFWSKVELANVKPKVYLFHDVIGEDEIDYIKNQSLSTLHRSIVVKDPNQGVTTQASIRISRTGWLSDIDHPLLKKISKRIQLLTGLETEYKAEYSNTEQYQVLNYGIGGMYTPHVDPLSIPSYEVNQGINPVENRYTGDRIATFMLYLSDVMYGGATVFPEIKARVPVTKGAAAFWYNLYLNGTINQNMLHAGCPVLVGSKWVSNKWIREIGQTFRRPCGLKRRL